MSEPTPLFVGLDVHKDSIAVAYAQGQRADPPVHGEVIGLAKDRSEDSLAGLLTTGLDARQRAAVTAVCLDMHQPYMNAVTRELSKAAIVFDKECAAAHSLSYGESSEMWRGLRASLVYRHF